MTEPTPGDLGERVRDESYQRTGPLCTAVFRAAQPPGAPPTGEGAEDPLADIRPPCDWCGERKVLGLRAFARGDGTRMTFVCCNDCANFILEGREALEDLAAPVVPGEEMVEGCRDAEDLLSEVVRRHMDDLLPRVAERLRALAAAQPDTGETHD